MRHALIALVIAGLIVAWIEPAAQGEEEPQETWQGVSASWSRPEPVAVIHFKPEPVQHAMRLAAIGESYLGLDIPAYPPVVEVLRIDQSSDPILVPPKPARKAFVPPTAYLTAAEMDDLLSPWFAPEDMDWARRVSACESTWNPNALNSSSGAAGLFQFVPRTWNWIAGLLGYPDYASGAPFDPHMNVGAAATLFYHKNGGPGHWVCK